MDFKASPIWRPHKITHLIGFALFSAFRSQSTAEFRLKAESFCKETDPQPHHPKIILPKMILPKKQSPSHTTQQLFCEKNRVPEPTHFRQNH
jgi:hypothetical protein